MKKFTSILAAGIYMVLAVLFGVVCTALAVGLTGSVYGMMMGAILSTSIIILIFKY